MKKIIFVLAVFLLSLIVVILNFRFLYFAGGDQSLYINLPAVWHHITNFWDENISYVLGGENFSAHLAMPLVLFFKLFSFLPIIVVEYAYFTAVIASIFLTSYYFFYTYHFKKAIPSLLASLLYLFNPFFFVSYPNYNIHLSFIVLPLLVILCHEILKNNIHKAIILTLLISLTTPSIFTNLPAVLPVFLAVLIYFFYLLLELRKSINLKKTFYSLIIFSAIFLLLNIWWIYPYIHAFNSNKISQAVYQEVGNMFRTTSLSDAFRFLGGWAFNSFNLNFDKGRYDNLYINNFVFVLCTFAIIVLAFATSLFYKKNRRILFFLFLALLGLTLVKGDLEPFGQLFYWAWQNIPGMIMFREPFTKFMLIYVFSLAGLLGYFIYYCFSRQSKNKLKLILYAFVLIILLIISFPFIIGGFVPSRYHAGPTRSYLVKTPSYLKEYEKFLNKQKLNFRLISYPKTTQVYLWEEGFNIDDTVLKYFAGQRSTISSFTRTHYYSNHYILIKQMYDFWEQEKINSLLSLLRLTNVGFLIMENSKDWRWSDAQKPSQMELIFNQFENNGLIEKIQEFGKFDPKTLSKIPVNAPAYYPGDHKLSPEEKKEFEEEAISELIDKPAILVYKINGEYFLPVVYAADEIITSYFSEKRITELMSKLNISSRPVIYFTNQIEDKKNLPSDSEGLLPKLSLIKKESPIIEYQKIKPTKYQLAVHKAKNSFPLVLSEAYNKGWKIYLTKYQSSADYQKLNDYKIFEGSEKGQANQEELKDFVKSGIISALGNGQSINFISKNFGNTIQNDNLSANYSFLSRPSFSKNKTAIDANHFIANGYANSWIIEPQKFCRQTDFCRQNADGSYDLAMTIEFYPQKYFTGGIILSMLTTFGCIIFLVFFKKKH